MSPCVWSQEHQKHNEAWWWRHQDTELLYYRQDRGNYTSHEGSDAPGQKMEVSTRQRAQTHHESAPHAKLGTRSSLSPLLAIQWLELPMRRLAAPSSPSHMHTMHICTMHVCTMHIYCLPFTWIFASLWPGYLEYRFCTSAWPLIKDFILHMHPASLSLYDNTQLQ